MFCWNCGAKIPDKSKFCMSCGAKIEISNDDRVPTVTEETRLEQKEEVVQVQEPPVQFMIQGIKLEFPSSIQEYTKRRKEFANKLEPFILDQQKSVAQSLSDLNAGNIDNCIDIITTFGVNVSNKMVDTVHQNLLREKIYTVSREQIATLYNNIPQHFAKEFDFFYEKYLEVIGSEEAMKQARELKRAGRGYWQGGGFGISGALVGAAKAGALNAITGMFRGLIDAFTDASDRNKAYKNKVALLQSKPWAIRFQNLLLEDMYLMYDVYANLLAEQGKLILPNLDISLSQTYLDNGRRSSTQKDQVDLFIRALQSYPYNRSAYLALGKIVGYDNREILKAYDYFMTFHHIKWYLNIVLSSEFSVKIKSISGASYEELDKKIALEDHLLLIVDNLKHISDSFAEACKPYEQNAQNERQEFLNQRLTSDDGIRFQSIEDLNLYLKERDEYSKYRQETLTRIVPFERQNELLTQAETRNFQNPYTRLDMAQWKTELINCSKARETYSKSFEHYFFRSCKGSAPNKVVARFPLEVQKILANVPFISITQFTTIQVAKIRPSWLSFSEIEAWFFASDFYVGVVIPNRSEAHVVRSRDLARIELQEDVLTFYFNDSTHESTKLLLPSEGDPTLFTWIDTINGMLRFARNRISKNLCPVCGQPLFEGATFCGGCGYKL